MVRPRRLELPCLAALPPQGSASTNFATVAHGRGHDLAKKRLRCKRSYSSLRAMKWETSLALTDYESAVTRMEQRVADIRSGVADELVWLVEHPPLYTSGSSAKAGDLLDPQFPVHQTGRGGQYTYHGPGQRVAYVMLDLKRRAESRVESRESSGVPDLRKFVQNLEQWIILTLAEFGVQAFTREGRIGVWVDTVRHPAALIERAQDPTRFCASALRGSQNDAHTEKKIAALGIRIRGGVSYHGIAINVNPDLSHYAGIVPCGIREFGVTSLHDVGVMASMDEVDVALERCFEVVFASKIGYSHTS